jgi:hypothetical protein
MVKSLKGKELNPDRAGINKTLNAVFAITRFINVHIIFLEFFRIYPRFMEAMEMAFFAESVKFAGFKREGRAPGIRNGLWIFPTMPDICGELRALRDGYHKPYWIDSVSVLDESCFALASADVLSGLAANPNVCGALFAGPGVKGSYTRALPHARILPMISPKPSEDEAILFGVILDGLAANTTRTRVNIGFSSLRAGVALDPDLTDPGLRAAADGLIAWLSKNGARVSISGQNSPESALTLAANGAQVIIRAAPESKAIPCAAQIMDISPEDMAGTPEKTLKGLIGRFLRTLSP